MINTKPEVKIIADSIAHDAPRLTTFQVKYWRPLLAETNTHRVFSRNASSSRARSFESMCDEAVTETFCPAHWNHEQKGMQGGAEFDEEIKAFIDGKIQDLADITVQHIKNIDEEVYARTGHHIHKQYLNRYTEPFRPVIQLITATEWRNWNKLRISDLAQPEIMDLANLMSAVRANAQPTVLTDKGWHLPYIIPSEWERFDIDTLKKLSVARCARVSYGTSYKADVERDIALHDRLLKNGHLSPFEHVATPSFDKTLERNLKGWIQYRTLNE